MSLAPPTENLTRAEAERRAHLVKVESYRIEVDFTDPSGEHPGEVMFRSRTVVQFLCSDPGASTYIDLTASRLSRAELNGRPLTGYDGHRLQLPGLATDNRLVVESEMAYMNNGAGVHRFVDPVDEAVYLYTQFEPFDAHRMYACFDQPDLKAVFRFTVRAPKDWVVISNETHIQAPPLGRAGVWDFAATPVIAPYITALAAGPFVVASDQFDGISLGLYCRRSTADNLDAAELFELTKQGLEFYQREFGLRYPFRKYDQIFVAEMLHGGMENAGAVIIDEGLLFRSKVSESRHEQRAILLLHEMAHMWFGNLVTMRWWGDLWLNESFATYASLLCLAEATRYRGGWVLLANEAKAWAYEQDEMPTTHAIVCESDDIEAVRVNFDAISYAKGAAVLKQLVARIGRESFIIGLREYFRKHEWGNTTIEDLLTALESASGQNLSQWSAQWLESAGVNTLRPVIQTDESGMITHMSIVQEAPSDWPTLRSHVAGVGFYELEDGMLVRRFRDEVEVSGERTDLPGVAGRHRPTFALLNDGDLTYAKIRLDTVSLQSVLEHISRLDDPLARALCWAAAWDMTRDAEMRARDFVSLVQRGLSKEQGTRLVETLLARGQVALNSYADPAWTPSGKATFAATVFEALAESEPGGDDQLTLAQAAIELTSTPQQVAELQNLLNGSHRLRGLEVDQDLRWRLLRRLTVLGHADEEAIGAETRRDPTATGERQARICLAARPSLSAKHEAWVSVVEHDDLPQVVQVAIVEGFSQPEQADLLERFVEPYFDKVGQLWVSRGAALANALAVGLFPSHVIAEAVLDRADAFLSGDPPDGLARLVREGRDRVERSLRARHFDSSAEGR